MSKSTRIFLIVLNTVCLPVNMQTFYRGFSACQRDEWGFGLMLMALATFAFAWCSMVVYTYTKILLDARKRTG